MLRKVGVYTACICLGLLTGYIVFSDDSESENVSKSVEPEDNGKWSCSMHPHIEGKEDGKCPLCAMDLVLMDTSEDDNITANAFKMSKNAMALADVHTYEIGESNEMDFEILLSGYITTNKETDAIQTTLFDGRLDKLFTNYVGKKVRKGQQIGIIYSPELYAAQDKLLSSISYRDTHKKLFNATRNTLGLWKITDTQIEEILATGKPIMNFPLLADVSGTITEVIASEGKYYEQGAILYRTSDLRTVWVELDAYQEQLSSLKVGQPVTLMVEGLADNKIESKINFIEPVLNQSKRTLKVRIVLRNPDDKLYPGMIVKGLVKGSVKNKEAVVVPKSAVLWTGEKSYVYKKLPMQTATFEFVEVKLGKNVKNGFQILEGLNIGDIVVSNGVFTVDAAAQLNGHKSMMNNTTNDDLTNDASKIRPSNQKNRDLNAKEIISDGLKEGMGNIIDCYIDLKDALVSSNFEKVNDASKLFLKTLQSEVYTNDSDKKFIGDLKDNLKEVIGYSNIEKQRKVFKKISNSIIISMDNAYSDDSLYLQHCDCADNFAGGSWLSYEKVIANPYFGDAMLTCGRVEKVFD